MIYSKNYKLEYKNLFLEIRTLENILPGMHINYEGNKYICFGSGIKLINGLFVNDIILAKMSTFIIDKIYNESIKGSSILAKVLDVLEKDGKAYLKVDLEYGLENKNKGFQTKNKEFKLIPYKTFYSQNETGLFPAPEYDDIVDVEFFSKDETDMKISWALENKEGRRFNNNSERVFKNENILLKISKGDIEISGLDNYILKSNNINVNSENYICKSNKNFVIGSNGIIALESIDETSIFFKSLKMISREGSINIKSKSDILLKAKNIHTT